MFSSIHSSFISLIPLRQPGCFSDVILFLFSSEAAIAGDSVSGGVPVTLGRMVIGDEDSKRVETQGKKVGPAFHQRET